MSASLGKAVEPRFASLSSGLLARKGQAKPAMRPQGFGGFGNMTMGHEDLGWNDMGYDHAEPAGGFPPRTPPVPVLSAAAFPDVPAPAVLQQREALADEYAAGDEPVDEAVVADASEPAPVVGDVAADDAPAAAPILSVKPDARRTRSVVAEPVLPAPRSGGRKAAFTLRLDADRHLRLRLACAVGNRSAQQFVLDALDRLLGTIPELDDLAERVPARSAE